MLVVMSHCDFLCSLSGLSKNAIATYLYQHQISVNYLFPYKNLEGFIKLCSKDLTVMVKCDLTTVTQIFRAIVELKQAKAKSAQIHILLYPTGKFSLYLIRHSTT